MKIADKWNKRLTNSPFNVDLVAEDERIFEENRIRIEDESTIRKEVTERKDKAKNEIIIKALAEFSDMEALRQEKRAIMEEEHRLKALLTLEKANANLKADRLAAERAEKQRSQAKLAHRRDAYRSSLSSVVKEEGFALKKKHGIENRVGKYSDGRMDINEAPIGDVLDMEMNSSKKSSTPNSATGQGRSRSDVNTAGSSY